MLYNKNQVRIANDKKKLIKKGKSWIVASVFVLALATGGYTVTGQVNADATNSQRSVVSTGITQKNSNQSNNKNNKTQNEKLINTSDVHKSGSSSNPTGSRKPILSKGQSDQSNNNVQNKKPVNAPKDPKSASLSTLNNVQNTNNYKIPANLKPKLSLSNSNPTKTYYNVVYYNSDPTVFGEYGTNLFAETITPNSDGYDPYGDFHFHNGHVYVKDFSAGQANPKWAEIAPQLNKKDHKYYYYEYNSNSRIGSWDNRVPQFLSKPAIAIPQVVEISGYDGHTQTPPSGNKYQISFYGPNYGQTGKGGQYPYVGERFGINGYELFDSHSGSNDGKNNINSAGYNLVNPNMEGVVQPDGSVQIIPQAISFSTAKGQKTITTSNYNLESKRAQPVIAKYFYNGQSVGSQTLPSGYLGDVLKSNEYHLNPPVNMDVTEPNRDIPYQNYLTNVPFNVDYINKFPYNIPFYAQEVNQEGQNVGTPQRLTFPTQIQPEGNTGFIYVPLAQIPKPKSCPKAQYILPSSQQVCLYTTFGHRGETSYVNCWKGSAPADNNTINSDGYWSSYITQYDPKTKVVTGNNVGTEEYNNRMLIKYVDTTNMNQNLLKSNISYEIGQYYQLPNGKPYLVPANQQYGSYTPQTTWTFPKGSKEYPNGKTITGNIPDITVPDGTVAKIPLSPNPNTENGPLSPDQDNEWGSDSPYLCVTFHNNEMPTYSVKHESGKQDGIYVHQWIPVKTYNIDFRNEYGYIVGQNGIDMGLYNNGNSKFGKDPNNNHSTTYNTTTTAWFKAPNNGTTGYSWPDTGMDNFAVPFAHVPKGYVFDQIAENGNNLNQSNNILWFDIRGARSQFVISFKGVPELIDGFVGENTPFGPINPDNQISHHNTISAKVTVPLIIEKVNHDGSVVDYKKEDYKFWSNFSGMTSFTLPSRLSDYANKNWLGYKLETSVVQNEFVPDANVAKPLIWKYVAQKDTSNDTPWINVEYEYKNGSKWTQVPNQDLPNGFTNGGHGLNFQNKGYYGDTIKYTAADFPQFYKNSHFLPYSGSLDVKYNYLNAPYPIQMYNQTTLVYRENIPKSSINVLYFNKENGQPVSGPYSCQGSSEVGTLDLSSNGPFNIDHMPSGYTFDYVTDKNGHQLDNDTVSYPEANHTSTYNIWVNPEAYEDDSKVTVVERYKNGSIIKQFDVPVSFTGETGSVHDLTHNTSVINGGATLDQIAKGYTYDSNSDPMSYVINNNGGYWNGLSNGKDHPIENYDLAGGVINVQYIDDTNPADPQPLESSIPYQGKIDDPFNLEPNYYSYGNVDISVNDNGKSTTLSSPSLIPNNYVLDSKKYPNNVNPDGSIKTSDGLEEAIANGVNKYRTEPQTINIYLVDAIATATPDKPGNSSTNIPGTNNKWPAGTDKNSLTKTVTREIDYVDQSGHSIAPSVYQDVTFTRTAKVDKKTGKFISYTNWESKNASFSEVSSPDLRSEGFTNPSLSKVPSDTINGDTPDETIQVVYSDKSGNQPTAETKAITRTINYLDRTTNKPVASPVVQTVTFTRTPTIDQATGIIINHGHWSSNHSTWDSVNSHIINGYNMPSEPTVPSEIVNPTDLDNTVDVYYDPVTTVTPNDNVTPGQPIDPSNPSGPKWPAGTNKDSLSKQITRTINYLDQKGNHIAPSTIQKVTYDRTITVDKVTGKIVNDYSQWKVNGQNYWSNVNSPKITGYDDPSEAVVPKQTVGLNDPNKVINVIYKVNNNKPNSNATPASNGSNSASNTPDNSSANSTTPSSATSTSSSSSSSSMPSSSVSATPSVSSKKSSSSSRSIHNIRKGMKPVKPRNSVNRARKSSKDTFVHNRGHQISYGIYPNSRKAMNHSDKFKTYAHRAGHGHRVQKLPQTSEPQVHSSIWAAVFASVSAMMAGLGRAIGFKKHHE